MNSTRCTLLLGVSFAFGLAHALASSAPAENEENVWPVKVSQTDRSGRVVSWEAAGPLLYKTPLTDGGSVSGIRPLYADWKAASGATHEINVLYPVFTYRTDGEVYRWSFLQLINRGGNGGNSAAASLPQPKYDTFDVWPFWFSRSTGSSESSYRALLPVAGRIKQRFGQDELSWILFPLYVKTAAKGATTFATPWPIIKTTRGTEQGFAIWPLFGSRKKPDVYRRSFFLWPLGWNNTIEPQPESSAGTPARREIGFIPFYTRETDAAFINEIYLWPFFGYSDRTGPKQYHETRYFWPFIVKGRGENRSVDRFGPFYTRSVNKGVEKIWLPWPLYRQKRYSEDHIAHTRRQVLYFIYSSAEQRSLTNPSAAPAAKSHLWPLYSKWDNGAGRRQLQFPSPLGIFFPDNERVRQSWTPLFTLYRHDQQSPGNVRDDALWGLMSWTRSPARSEFHFGPLVSVARNEEGNRVAFGNGLVGLKRTKASGWRLFWFDFPSKGDRVREASR